MLKLISQLKNINFRKEPKRNGLVYFGDLTLNEHNFLRFETLTEVTGNLNIVYPAQPNLKYLARVGGNVTCSN